MVVKKGEAMKAYAIFTVKALALSVAFVLLVASAVRIALVF